MAASVVLLRPTPADNDVRDIFTGANRRHWTAEREAVAITGTTIVRPDAEGATLGRGRGLRSGALARPADGLRPSFSLDSQGNTLAMPDGTLLFSRTERDLPTFFDPDAIRMVDPRTGRAASAASGSKVT